MGSAVECWEVKNKTPLLLAVMEALAGNARISFEGDLHGFRLANIPGATDRETTLLRRNTLRPIQDFVVLPLEPTMVGTVLPAIGGNVPRRILHIQIEKDDALQFSAYDNFHPGCILFGPAVSRDLLQSFVSQGILSSCVPRPR
jgi:hypothetical protein